MDVLGEGMYPAGPSNVPEEVRRPGAAYRRRAWLAAGSQLVFLALYGALAAWFAWTGYRLVTGASGALVVAGVVGLAIALYMVSAVVAMPSTPLPPLPLLSEREQPRLFAFVRRLAAEVGAPMPHLIFVAPDVNAAVVTEISLSALVVPPRRHLVIGLGLVNTLSLGEWKAVLAHELGHSGQYGTLTGRWTYVAVQVTRRIALHQSRIDGAIRAIMPVHGVVLVLGGAALALTWAIRSLTYTLFGWTMRFERAFRRELELHADRIAAVAAGSDAVVHGLHRAEVAQDSFDAAVAHARREAVLGFPVADVFAVQRRRIEHLRTILDEPDHGRAPPPPADPATHRVFTPAFAHPPRTWQTHPSDDEREENVKRPYLAAPRDDRPAWVLFDDVAGLCARTTARHFAVRGGRAPVSLITTMQRLDESLSRPSLDRRYRGMYLDRLTTVAARDVTRLYATEPEPARVAEALAACYPPSLHDRLERARELAIDVALLEGLSRGVLESPGRTIRYRGRDHRRRDLPALLAAASRERDDARRALAAEDATCRAVHRAAARIVGRGWDRYLGSLVAALHCLEHLLALLEEQRADLARRLEHAVALGDDRGGHVALVAVSQLWSQLHVSSGTAIALELSAGVIARLTVPDWTRRLTLPRELPPHVLDRLVFTGGAADQLAGAIADVRRAVLDELLVSEARCAAWATAGGEPDPAPAPLRVPGHYPTADVEAPPPAPPRLDAWTRLRLADGRLAATAHVVAAVAIIAGLVLAARHVVHGDVVVYNGLDREVVVAIGGDRVRVRPRDAVWVEVPGGRVHVEARTASGEVIEAFDVQVADYRRQVYNVAGAAPLHVYQAEYRDVKVPGSPQARGLGAPRWLDSDTDYVFTQLPWRVGGRRGRSETRTVLDAPRSNDPLAQLSALGATDDPARWALVAAHLRWDPLAGRFAGTWWQLAAYHWPAETRAIVQERLIREGDEVALRRLEQDLAVDREGVCRDHAARAAARPDDPRWQGLAARCLTEPERKTRVAELARRWPHDPWLQRAVAIDAAERGDFATGARQLTAACASQPGECDSYVLEVVRWRRAANGLDAAIADLPLDGTRAATVLTPPVGSWQEALAAGDLEAAVARASDATLGRVLWLAAASDHASEEIFLQATVAGDAGLDPLVRLVAYALRRRMGRAGAADRDLVIAALPPIAGDAAAIRGFLERVEADGPLDAAAADAALGAVEPVTRGYLYTAAAILRGDHCPPAWRALARALLFVDERPFFE